MPFAEQNPADLLPEIEMIVETTALKVAQADPTLKWVLNHVADWKFFLKIAALGIATLPHRDDPGFLDEVDRQLEAWNEDAKPAIKNLIEFVANRDPGTTEDLPSWVGLWVLWNVKQSKEAPVLEEARAAPKVGAFCLRVASLWDQAPR